MFQLKPIRHYQAYEKNIKNTFYNCILGLKSQHSQAKNILLLMVQQPLVGQGLLNMEVSLSHSDKPHSVGLLWTNDQPDAETSALQHTTLTRYIHAPGVIKNLQVSCPRPTSWTSQPLESTKLKIHPFCIVVIRPDDG